MICIVGFSLEWFVEFINNIMYEISHILKYFGEVFYHCHHYRADVTSIIPVKEVYMEIKLIVLKVRVTG